MILQQNLLDEVFKWCLNDDEILDIVCSNLSSSDIPKDLKSYDTVLAILKKEGRKNGRLSLGEVQQKFYARGFDDDMIFERIRTATLHSKDGILESLENHIKHVKAIQAYEDFGDNYHKGDKDKILEEFIENVASVTDVDFSIHNAEVHNPFTDLLSEVEQAEIDDMNDVHVKMPLFIPPIDDIIEGIDKYDTALFILPSGGGKSTILKTIGFNLSRNGFRGIHFQLEGGQREALMKYGSIASAVSYPDLMRGKIPDKKLKRPRHLWFGDEIIKIETFKEAIYWNDIHMRKRRELFHEFDMSLIPFTMLGSPTTGNIESYIQKWIDMNGCNPDYVIIDSIDLIYPSDGNRYSTDASGMKSRLQAASKLMKNMATKFETRVLTATQTSNIDMEDWNNPDFVITRNHVMGDKNMVNPFSYVFSGNRTIAETKGKVARIYIDKLRHQAVRKPVVFVNTDFDNGKYVDIPGTIKKFSKMNDPDYVPPLEEKTDEEPKDKKTSKQG